MTITDRIIKIEPATEFFSVTWLITGRCNYECMYCPARFHDNTNPHHTLEELQSHWSSIFEKTSHLGLKYKIAISGGEATTNKNLLPMLQWLRSKYGNYIGLILLTTNGSASTNYYKKLYTVIDNISFGAHSEYLDEIKFFKKMIELHNFIKTSNKFLHVDLMDESWNQERISYYEKILQQHAISYSRNAIKYDVGTRSYPMLKGQLNFDLSQPFQP